MSRCTTCGSKDHDEDWHEPANIADRANEQLERLAAVGERIAEAVEELVVAVRELARKGT